MKRIVWSVVALLAIASPSLAQDKKGYIGISLGPSIPLGDLASKDIDNESAGFATSGAIFDISVAYKLGKGPFGITAMLRGQIEKHFAKLADLAGISPPIFDQVMARMVSGNEQVQHLVSASFLSQSTQRNYLQLYQSRLKRLRKAFNH